MTNYLIVATLLVAAMQVVAEPQRLLALRTNYEAALTKAKAPVEKAYLQELNRLKTDFVKAGNLEDALAIDLEIKKLPPEVLASAIPLGTPVNKPVNKVVIKARVDGDDNIIIQDGKLLIQHGGWKFPQDISVNGVKWKPVWNGNTSEELKALKPPLAPFVGATATVKKVKGRGDASILEQPTPANKGKLIVQMRDDGNDSSEFEVHISW